MIVNIYIRRMYTRRITWSFYPSGFFPRLILRLAHLRIRLLASWLDAAIIMGRDDSECAFLRLAHSEAAYHLEVFPQYISYFIINMEFQVKVKSEGAALEGAESLIVELSYVISRLHRDMYMLRAQVALEHHVIIASQNSTSQMKEVVSQPNIT